MNAAWNTVISFGTFGFWDGGQLIPVDPLTDQGYETAYFFARIGTEAGFMALTGGFSCASKVGKVINLIDAAGSAADLGRGIADISQNGLTLGNVTQTGLNLVGTLLGFKNCFSRDTLVATPSGPRPMGEIRPGELVLAYDFEAGEWVPRPVRERHDNYYEGALLTLTTDGGTVRTTMYHPFWVVSGHELHERSQPRELSEHEDEGLALDGRWVNSHELRAGDVLIGEDGRRLRLLRSVQEYVEFFPICNLTIEENHTFAVGPDRLLVHNTSGCGRMTKAEALENGLTIRDEGWLTRGLHEAEDHHLLSQGKSFADFWDVRGIARDVVDKTKVRLPTWLHRAIDGESTFYRDLLRGGIRDMENRIGRYVNAEEALDIGYNILADLLKWVI